MRILFAIASAAGFALAACSGASPAGPTSPASSSAPTPSTAPAGSASAAAVPTVWQHDMPKDQQIAFMGQRIMPPMGKVFKEHDGKRFADFSCKTCHGPQYKEPKEFLTKLVLKDGKITSFAEKPEVSKWMAEQVVPAMATAMGMKPYDPQTHQGFGCGGCHAIEKQLAGAEPARPGGSPRWARRGWCMEAG